MASPAIFVCNGGMVPGGRLRLEITPSRSLRRAVIVAVGATLLMLLALPLGPALHAWGGMLVVLVGIREHERCVGRGLPPLLHLGIDHRLTVSGADGRAVDGRVLPGTFVTARCVCLRWRPDVDPGRAGWPRTRTILIVGGMVDAEAFRELRVRLRYGAGRREENSGAPSRRPASHSAASNTRPLAAFD